MPFQKKRFIPLEKAGDQLLLPFLEQADRGLHFIHQNLAPLYSFLPSFSCPDANDFIETAELHFRIK